MNVKSQGLNNKGFSLIELMVVVGIIGILATVAVPQVTKFMAKAKQSEAKTNLASIYTSNKSYLVEYDGYTGQFGRMGYSPEGTLTYNIGFDGVVGAYPDQGPKDNVTNAQLTATVAYADSKTADAYCGIQVAAGADNSAAASSTTCRVLPINGTGAVASTISAAADVSANTFIAEADGVIINNTGVTDQWQINEAKQLTNTISGLQ